MNFDYQSGLHNVFYPLSLHPSIHPDKLLCHRLSRDTKTLTFFISSSRTKSLQRVLCIDLLQVGHTQNTSPWRIFHRDIRWTPPSGCPPSCGLCSHLLMLYTQNIFLERISLHISSDRPLIKCRTRTTRSSYWVYELLSASCYPTKGTNFSWNFRKSKTKSKKRKKMFHSSLIMFVPTML